MFDLLEGGCRFDLLDGGLFVVSTFKFKKAIFKLIGLALLVRYPFSTPNGKLLTSIGSN